MIHTDLVSVITPSYNSERFIEETIRSVQNQTYTNWEMIIVDDCSNDGTRVFLEKLVQKDDRIKVYYLKENSGAAIARNKALKEAKGKYVAFLDSDDLWYPEKLEKQLEFMKQKDIAFSFTAYEVMNEDGVSDNKKVEVPESIDYHGLLKNTIIGCLTVMIDREKTGYFEMPNIRTRQDFALWLLILRNGHIAYGLNEVLSKYRVVKGSISSNKFKAAKKTWYVYTKVEKLNFIYASWCFINYSLQAIKKRL